MTRAAPTFTHNALLLVGHGSSSHADAARLLYGHAEVLRQAGHFAEVAVGLLKGDPAVEAALRSLATQRVHVVPFFMEDGYFTRVAVPRALMFTETALPSRVRLCPPVGVHEDMVALIAARVSAHCAGAGWREDATALLLIGHGSARSPGR